MHRFFLCFVVLAWSTCVRPAGVIAQLTAEAAPPPSSAAPLRDEVRAQALFAHSRLLLNRGNRLGALRRLQRAWRYAPNQRRWLPQIVALAEALDRPEEAAEYGYLWAQGGRADANSLVDVAALQTTVDRTARALAVYELALPKVAGPKRVLLHLEAGRLAFERSEFRRAAKHLLIGEDAWENPNRYQLAFGQLEQLVSDPALLCAMTGEACLAVGDVQAAERAFARGQQFKPDRRQAALQTARLAVKRRQLDRAAAALDSYFALPGRIGDVSPLPLYKKLIELDVRRDSSDYCRLLESLRATTPDDEELVFALATELTARGEPDRAISLLRSSPVRRWSKKRAQLLAQLLITQRDAHRLTSLLVQLIRQNGDLDWIDQALTAAGSDETLRAAVLHACQSSPGVQVQQRRWRLAAGVRFALAAGDLDGARKMQNQLESVANDRAEVLTDWAFELLDHDFNAPAATAFARLAAADADDDQRAARFFYLAGAQAVLGDWRGAAQTAERCVKLAPDSPRYQDRLAWLSRKSGREQRAVETYHALLGSCGPNPQGDAREYARNARRTLAKIAAQNEQWSDAQEWLEQILDQSPGDLGALNDLGYLWVDRGQHLPRALAMIQQAVKGSPQNPAYRDSLGWALYQLGRYDEAVRELETAAKKSAGVTLDHLGDAYWKVSRKQEARSAWRRAAESLDDQQHRQAVLKKIKERAVDPNNDRPKPD